MLTFLLRPYTVYKVSVQITYNLRQRGINMDNTELKSRRIALGLTQRELADLLRTTVTSVARWERGEMRFSYLLELAMNWIEHTRKPASSLEYEVVRY